MAYTAIPAAGTGGGVTTITSTGATVTITNPTGPTVNLETTGTTYTFSSGLTNTTGTVTNDYATGKAGGQTITFGTGAGDNATYVSTTNATKGKHIFDGRLTTSVSGSTGSAVYQTNGGVNYGVWGDATNVGLTAGGQTVYVANNGVFNAGNISNPNNNTIAVTLGATGIIYGGSQTVASATSAVLNAHKWQTTTQTFSGSTAITTAAGVNFIDVEAPTYTAAGAVAITSAATMTIKAAPTVGGSLTITNPYALWVQAGTTKLDGGVAIGNSLATAGAGVIVTTNAPAGVLSLNLKYINMVVGGVATYVLALQ